MKTIVITGTPGTGKSTLAALLCKTFHYTRIDVNNVIKQYHLSEGYDRRRKTKIIDTKKLNTVLQQIIQNSSTPLVIDSHLAHDLPKRYVDVCVVTTTDLGTLKKRLQKRRYSTKKITENLQAEIFHVCLEEAQKRGHKIMAVNTSNKQDLKKLFSFINHDR